MMPLIGLGDLATLTELAIWSAAVANERNPASMLLVAVPESGKTDLILSYEKCPWVRVSTDLTGWGLVKRVVEPLAALPPDRAAGRVLAIPDLTSALARSSEVVGVLCGVLASFMEEGVQKVDTFQMQLDLARPVAGGVITSCTPGEYSDKRYSWVRNGFSSRFLTITYSYDDDTQAKIAQNIWGATQNSGGRVDLGMPDRPVAVGYEPRNFAPLERLVSDYLREFGLDKEAYGFRLRKQLRRLTLGSALRAGRNRVSMEDLRLVEYLINRYANTRYTPAR